MDTLLMKIINVVLQGKIIPILRLVYMLKPNPRISQPALNGLRSAVLCSIITACLWGCSSRTIIHLHPEVLDPPQIESIVEELASKGFSVKIENNEAPAMGNTIIYSPQRNIEEQLASITKVLENHSLIIDQIFIKSSGGEDFGNHTYTAGHIGVYLAEGNGDGVSRGVEIRSTFPINMIGDEFVSSNCDVDYVYDFFESGNLTVTNISSLTEDLGGHTWSDDDESIVIQSAIGPQYTYTKNKGHSVQQKSDLDIVAYTIKLKPAGFYPLPYSCVYTATFREAFGR